MLGITIHSALRRWGGPCVCLDLYIFCYHKDDLCFPWKMSKSVIDLLPPYPIGHGITAPAAFSMKIISKHIITFTSHKVKIAQVTVTLVQCTLLWHNVCANLTDPNELRKKTSTTKTVSTGMKSLFWLWCKHHLKKGVTYNSLPKCTVPDLKTCENFLKTK